MNYVYFKVGVAFVGIATYLCAALEKNLFYSFVCRTRLVGRKR